MKTQVTIIVADDDLDDQSFVREALNDTDVTCQMLTANNGVQVMDILLRRGENTENVVPDFILLDINMPILDGFGVLKQLGTYNDLKNIPVYILSTSKSAADISLSKELGAKGYFHKTIYHKELVQIMKQVCDETLSQ